MEIRFHKDPETGLPHIYEHGVTENEVREVLFGAGDDFRGRKNTWIKFGQTIGGRYLKLIYVPDEDGDGLFLITAYELKGKALKAFRRRQRRRDR